MKNKKAYLITAALFLSLGLLFSSEREQKPIVIFEGNAYGESGKDFFPNTYTIQYEDAVCSLCFLQFLEAYKIELTEAARAQIIQAIDKVVEWDVIAKKNNVEETEQPILFLSAYMSFQDFMYGWQSAGYVSLPLSFMVTGYDSYLLFDRVALKSKNSSSTFKGAAILIDELPEFRKFLLQENINQKLQEHAEKKEHIDSLFK